MTVINYFVTVKGVTYHEVFIEPSDIEVKTGGFPCQPLCRHQLSRPHLTCIPNGCGIHKAYYGKRENRRRVRTVHQIIVYDGLKHWQRAFAKKLFSLLEWVLDR